MSLTWFTKAGTFVYVKDIGLGMLVSTSIRKGVMRTGVDGPDFKFLLKDGRVATKEEIAYLQGQTNEVGPPREGKRQIRSEYRISKKRRKEGRFYVKALPRCGLGGRMQGSMPYDEAEKVRDAWKAEGFTNAKIIPAEQAQ